MLAWISAHLGLIGTIIGVLLTVARFVEPFAGTWQKVDDTIIGVLDFVLSLLRKNPAPASDPEAPAAKATGDLVAAKGDQPAPPKA